jgi:hypothetical protein
MKKIKLYPTTMEALDYLDDEVFQLEVKGTNVRLKMDYTMTPAEWPAIAEAIQRAMDQMLHNPAFDPDGE